MSDRTENPPKPSKSGSQTRQRSKLAALPCTPAELTEIEARAERAGLSVAAEAGRDEPKGRDAATVGRVKTCFSGRRQRG